MNQDTIFSLIRTAEQNYIVGNTKLSKYVNFSMLETINTIDAYINSKHTSGLTDSLGREKPFFNIVTAAINIWYRATDIDRKDIRLKATKMADSVAAFLGTIHLKTWMRRTNFGVFLNQWGRTLAQYGSAVVKFVEKDGVLYPQCIPWNRIIVDAIDFSANARIEKLYFTPAQLRMRKGYDQTAVENLITAVAARQTLDKETVDTIAGYIEVYEVHGELPLAFLKKDPTTITPEDKTTYRQQMHVVSFVQAREGYDDFELYKGKEKQDPYMITHLIEEDGRTLAIGAVEYLFDAQWMQNHTVKNMKDMLDLSSKLIFQTTDSNLEGRNVLTAVEQGDIITTAANTALTQVNNGSHDLAALQNFAGQWRAMAQELTSTPDALRGNTLPSGTPYSLGALLNQNASSLFEIMTENKGLAIEKMMRVFVIPHLKTKLNNGDEIGAELDAEGIAQIDSMYIPKEAIRRENQRVISQVLTSAEQAAQGKMPGPTQPFNADTAKQQVQSELASSGNMRFFTPDDAKKIQWNEVFKDFEWTCEVDVTDEETDKKTVLTTLNTVFQTIASNPMVLQNKNTVMLLGKILEATGTVSPIELSTTEQIPMPIARPTLRENVDFKDLPPPAQMQFLERMGMDIQQMQQAMANAPAAPSAPPR